MRCSCGSKSVSYQSDLKTTPNKYKYKYAQQIKFQMHLFAPPPCELHFLHLRILITAAITFVLQCSYCAATTEHNTMQYNTMEYTALQYPTTKHNTMQYDGIHCATTQYNTSHSQLHLRNRSQLTPCITLFPLPCYFLCVLWCQIQCHLSLLTTLTIKWPIGKSNMYHPVSCSSPRFVLWSDPIQCSVKIVLLRFNCQWFWFWNHWSRINQQWHDILEPPANFPV